MSDGTDTGSSRHPLQRHVIYDVSNERLPVDEEDDEIDEEVFGKRSYDTLSKRTGEILPAHLTKANYDPNGMTGELYLDLVVGRKVDRVVARMYPKYIFRDTERLYRKAKGDFEVWWGHLEDAYVAVDEEAVRQAYIAKYMDYYYGQVSLHDNKYPENLESHHRTVDRHIEAVLKTGSAPPYDWNNYTTLNERWRQNIAVDGRAGGAETVDEDTEIGMGFRDGAALKEIAKHRFSKWWQAITWSTYFEDQDRFDYPGLWTIYLHNFVQGYRERTDSERGSLQPPGPSARVISATPDRDSRIYLVEVSDPQNLTEPVQIEVAVKNEDLKEQAGTDDA